MIDYIQRHMGEAFDKLLKEYSLYTVVAFIWNHNLQIQTYREQLVALWTAHCINTVHITGEQHDKDFETVKNVLRGRSYTIPESSEGYTAGKNVIPGWETDEKFKEGMDKYLK